MLRHAAIEVARQSAKFDDAWIDTYIAGHNRSSRAMTIGSCRTCPSHRLATPKQTKACRAMIVAPVGDDAILEEITRRLSGHRLEPERANQLKRSVTAIYVRPDNVTRCYTKPANAWASVTPVILPGHDDHKPEKTRKLIEKAFAQSGIDQPCEFEWSAFSYFSKIAFCT